MAHLFAQFRRLASSLGVQPSALAELGALWALGATFIVWAAVFAIF